MKKSLLKVVGALALVSTIFFASCSNDVKFGDESEDSYTKLTAPKVTAVAYPGQITVSWTEVPDANGYDVQLLADGISIAVPTTPSNNSFNIATKVNNVEYTVRVAAIPSNASHPARAISVFDSKYGETKVKSIVPPAGTSALQLAAYEGGYDGKPKTTKDVLARDKIRVSKEDNAVYVSFQAKAYLSYSIALVNDYDEAYDADAIAEDSTQFNWGSNTIVKNNEWVERKLSVTGEGNYSVVVTATAKYNSTIYEKDVVAAATKVTYESLIPSESVAKKADNNFDITAKYVDNIRKVSEGETKASNPVRIMWTPVLYNGKPAPAEWYKVYRRTAYSNELVEVTKTPTEEDAGVVVKECNDNDTNGETLANTDKHYYENIKYYLDTDVEDATYRYTYKIVLSNEGKFAKSVSVDLAPKAADYVTLVASPAKTVSGTVKNTKVVNNVRKDDIEWTIKLANKYQTFAAYTLKKDYVASKGYDITPVVEDFDTTTDLAATAIQEDDTTFTIIQSDVPDGKYFMLVVVKEDGFKSKNVIGDAVTVSNIADPKITTGALVVNAIDNTINDTTNSANQAADKKNENDVVVTFTDTIDLTKETISSYTYKLYKAQKNVSLKPDGTQFYATMGKFVEVSGFAMEADGIPEAVANTATYKGIYKDDDLDAGTYVYKVVKTNAETKKYASITAEITIVDPTEKSLVPYIKVTPTFNKNVKYDSETKTWVPNDKLTATVNNQFVVKISELMEAVYSDSNAEKAGKPSSWLDKSSDLEFALYRTELVKYKDENGNDLKQTSAVYTKLDEVEFTKDKDLDSTDTMSTYKLASDGSYEEATSKEYITSKTFKAVDRDLPTTDNVTYSYVLVITKDGYKPYISETFNY